MNRADYPADWEAVSYFVRVTRARGQCECNGECYLGKPFGHKERCHEFNHTAAKHFKGKVILTTAHMCACVPLCGDPNHLRAMCQSCHLRFDRYHHQRVRQIIRERAKQGNREIIPLDVALRP